MANFQDTLQANQTAVKFKYPIDKRFYNTIYAEVGGGSPEEVKAVASAFLNRITKQGYDKALKGSSAYNKKSNEYLKAQNLKFNPFEAKIYERNQKIINDLIANSANILPYTHFENIKAFGEPSWAKTMKSYQDIGRQRFYIE